MADYDSALAVRFDSDAGDDLTVRGYLRTLLSTVWNEGESFSGKRPFGNSGWEFDILVPLAKAGFVDLGPVDETGEPFDWTSDQVNKASAFVTDLILHALREPTDGVAVLDAEGQGTKPREADQ